MTYQDEIVMSLASAERVYRVADRMFQADVNGNYARHEVGSRLPRLLWAAALAIYEASHDYDLDTEDLTCAHCIEERKAERRRLLDLSEKVSRLHRIVTQG